MIGDVCLSVCHSVSRITHECAYGYRPNTVGIGKGQYPFSPFLSFFLIWGDTRSLHKPELRPASQAGPMRNPREGTSVVLRDTTRLT